MTKIRQKVKGYQETFEGLLDTTRKICEPNINNSSINVDFESPAVAKLWNELHQ